jgi:hypothetical protein
VLASTYRGAVEESVNRAAGFADALIDDLNAPA